MKGRVKRKPDFAFKSSLVVKKAIRRRGIYIVTPMRKRQSDVIRDPMLLSQLGECIQSAHKVEHYPSIMEGSERTGLDPD